MRATQMLLGVGTTAALIASAQAAAAVGGWERLGIVGLGLGGIGAAAALWDRLGRRGRSWRGG